MGIDDSLIFQKENKEYNMQLRKNIIGIFDKALAEGRYEMVADIPGIIDSSKLVVTGELAKIFNILGIISAESSAKVPNHFFCDVQDFEQLYAKYLTIIIMLRRLELYPEEEFADEAVDFLKTISFEALSSIIGKELFEKKYELVCSVFHRVAKGDKEKEKWLKFISDEYSADWSCLELASIYIEQAKLKDAYEYLLKIQNPSSEIRELISEIQVILEN